MRSPSPKTKTASTKARRRWWLAVAAAAMALGVVRLPGELGARLPVEERQAEAIVGRPLTPVSYAGVARRTVRRTAVVAGTVYHPYYW